MKTKTLLLIVLVAMQGYNTFAQSYILRDDPAVSPNPASGTLNTNLYQSGSFLGVNNTTPVANLEVRSACAVGNEATLLLTRPSLTCPFAFPPTPSQTYGDYFVIKQESTFGDPTYPFIVKSSGRIGVGAGNNPDATFDLRGGSGLALISAKDNSNNVRFVAHGDGSVAINTSTTTNALLEMRNNSASLPIILARDNSNNVKLSLTNDGRMGINQQTPSYTMEVRSANSSTSPFAVFDGFGSPKILTSNSTVSLGSSSDVVDITGRLRIGAQAPNGAFASYKLGVDGDIIAKRVVVQTASWADHVFADNYNLATLDEVAAFIKQHKHLPEIPSEKEVLENGIDTGEMNRLLLQKVEELTLYLIEMKKEIETLKN